MRLLRIFLGIVLFLVVPFALAAPLPSAKAQRPAFWTTSWGIAAPDGKTVFITGSAGKVEALDLATGKVVWVFEDPGKPLALIGRRLAVEVATKDKANSVRVVLLNDKGQQVGQSDPVSFPERPAGARGFGPGNRPGPGSTTTAWSDGNKLFLNWRSRAAGGKGGRGGGGGRRGGPGGGGLPGGGGGGAGGPGGRMMTTTLCARIDLRSGKVEMLDPEDAPSPPSPKLPVALERPARGGRGGRPGVGPRIGTNGKYAVSITLSRGEDSKQAVLRRWDLTSGKALAPILLAKDAAMDAVLSADHRTVLVNLREQPDQDESSTFWRVYSTFTGKEVCAFAEQEGSSNVTALGNVVLIVVRKTNPEGNAGPIRPRILRALDMKDGKVLWEHPIEPLRAPARFNDNS